MQTEMILLPLLMVPVLTGFQLLVASLFSPTRLRFETFWGIVSCSAFVTSASMMYDAWLQRQDENRVTGLIWTLHGLPWGNIDWLAACWCCVAGASTVLLLHWPRLRETPSGLYRENFAGLWLFAASVVAVCADGVWLQWGGQMLCSWLLCLVLTRQTQAERSGTRPGVLLLWFTAADFLWLFGLLFLSQVWKDPQISGMSNVEELKQLGQEQIALIVTAHLFLILSLILRCGLFPLMTWTRSTAGDYRDAAWTAIYSIGFGAALLLRWSPMFGIFRETHQLLTGLGAVSAVLLGIQAVFGVTGPRRMLSLAAAQVGIIWVGQGLETAPAIASTGMAMMVMLLVTALCLGVEQLPTPRHLSRIPIAIQLTACLLCCGLIGQEFLLNAAFGSEEIGPLHPMLLAGAILIAQILTATAVFSELQGLRGQDPPERVDLPAEPNLVTRSGWVALGLVSLGVFTGVWFALPLILKVPLDRIQLPIPVVMSLATLIGLTVAWHWPDRPPSESAIPNRNSLRRLAQEDFALAPLFAVRIASTCSLVAWACLQMERSLFRPMVSKIPTRWLQQLTSVATLTEEDQSPSAVSWQLIAAIACMLIGWGASSWM